MTKDIIEKILKQVASRRLTPQRAFLKLRHLPYESLGFAKVDHHRYLRKGLPEVIYAPGKTLHQLILLTRSMAKSKQPFLITRLEENVFRSLKKIFPKLLYAKTARLAYFKISKNKNAGVKQVTILTAGTSDYRVAEEAAVTLEVLGISVRRLYDCGVAGLHRLLAELKEIRKSSVVICVAGMEGALPSVVAGLIDKPVVAVPTSVGYGSNFKGIAPLLTMLNSCAQGIAVVNIDNGFGAACFAYLVLRLVKDH